MKTFYGWILGLRIRISSISSLIFKRRCVDGIGPIQMPSADLLADLLNQTGKDKAK